MKKKGKMAACLILLVLLLAVLVVLTKKNSTADADSSSSDSGADAEKVVDFSKDDVTAFVPDQRRDGVFYENSRRR